jgi:CTP:molybdopterin cytidylyltransferase MocA
MSPTRAAMVLAAGASARMGAPKALLPWGKVSLLEYTVEQTRAAGADEVVVVLGPATGHLQVGATIVFNPAPERGRSASIRLGAAAIQAKPTAILIQSVDQPVPSLVIQALFEAVGGEVKVAVPTYQGRRGHPICVAGDVLGELRAVSEVDQGLRAVVRRHAAQLREVPVDTPAVLWNLNDPASYAAARSTAGR